MFGVNCINLNEINNELMIKVLLRSNSKTITFIFPGNAIVLNISAQNCDI